MNWLLLLLSFIIVSSLYAMPPHKGMPIAVAGDWEIKVGPGHVILEGRDIVLPEAVIVSIAPPQVVPIRDEKHPSLPLFDAKAARWRMGLHPRALVAQECVATGLLVPGSLKVKAGPGDAEKYIVGQDVQIEEYWTAVGRLPGGRLAENQPVWLDYDYVPCRLDSIVVDAKGHIQVVPGTPAVNCAQPPELEDGATAIARVWLQGPSEKLTDVNLYPIEPPEAPAPVSRSVAERFLPKTLEKLRHGDKILIIAWGDSVTCGGGVGAQTDLWYQHRFVAALRARFPQAQIELRTAGWGGRDSKTYMAQPRGAEKDFVRDVLEPRPDLVTIEFVNDAWLQGEALRSHYKEIVRQISSVGAEIIFIAPHLVRPDWLGVADPRFDEDPRPYVRDLKQFAQENQIALADVSTLWCRLWRQGIPYITYEANWINHPDARGHQLFADALLALFPEK